MPVKGYAVITVREEVKRRLEELKEVKGFSSLNDVIAYLLDRHSTLCRLEAGRKDDINRLYRRWVRVMDGATAKLDEGLRQQYLEAKRKLQAALKEV